MPSSAVGAVVSRQRHRAPAPERPQLPGARVPRARQRAGAELRPHEDEQRGRLLRRPVRARRQRHHRRRGQQRRRGRAARSRTCPQDAVQEFQIATNRFSAEQRPLGRVRHQRRDPHRGRTPCTARPRSSSATTALQALPATYDRTLGEAPPFDRQQYALALGGPIKKGVAWWFGALEYRDQDGAVLVGARDVATRTIRARLRGRRRSRTCSPPARVDCAGRTGSDRLAFRYAFENADGHGGEHPRPLHRLGHASARRARNRYHVASRELGDALSRPPRVNALSGRATATSDNEIGPWRPAAAAHVPRHPGRRQLPRAAGHRTSGAVQLADNLALVRGSHTLSFGGEVQRVTTADFDLGVFREGRVEMVEDFADFDRNGDGRVDDNDLLFAVTLRSGFPDRDLHPRRRRQHVLRRLRPGRLARHPAAHPEPGPALRAGHGRQERQPAIADIEPASSAVPAAASASATSTTSPRASASTGRAGAAAAASTAGYGLYYDRITLQIAVPRARAGRARAAHRGARRQRRSSSTPPTGQLPALRAHASAIPSPASSFPAPAPRGINIIDNGLENPQVQQFNLGTQRAAPRASSLRADGVHNIGTHFIIGRTVGRSSTPWWAGRTAS